GVGVDVIEAAINEEIQKVKDNLISDDEFQKLRNQVESEFVTANSRVAGIAQSLANYLMYYGDANLINTELERYLAVTKEDIQQAARKYYRDDRKVVLHQLPKQDMP